MKRRNFIQLSAFATAAISLPFLHSCSSSATEQAIAHPLFLSRLFDKNTINDAGKAYLKNTHAESNKDKLVQLLADNNIANSKDEKKIHDYLDKKIQNDFEAGNTVMVNGWILAVTEARQCALFSLIKN